MDVRLLAFTGPGGFGKTRLAVEVARQASDRLADGVVDAGDSGLVSLVICDGPAGVDGAQRVLDPWLGGHLTPSPGEPAMVITGDVIAQRGL